MRPSNGGGGGGRGGGAWLEEGVHVESSEGELDVTADLVGGDVSIIAETLEVDAQHLRQLHDAHLLKAVLKTTHKKSNVSINSSLHREQCVSINSQGTK